MQKPPRFARATGFTLIELSVVLMLLSLMLGGILTAVNQEGRRAKQNELKSKLAAIEEALIRYRLANNRMPCPGNLALVTTHANYGQEAANPGTCTGGAPAASHTDAINTVGGAVPVHALRLPDDYMYDPWGGKFLYMVDRRATGQLTGAPTNGEARGVLNDHLPPGTSGTFYSVANTTIGSITVNGTAGTYTPANNLAVVAIVSHGANGHGAFQRSGVQKFTGSMHGSEWENCSCIAAAAAAFNATLIMRPATLSTSGAFSYDDYLFFMTRQHLKSGAESLTEK
jgi:prepilin-type N-terminal cleavage/methylation domain-containing protein